MSKQNTAADKSAAGKRNSQKRMYTYRKVTKKTPEAAARKTRGRAAEHIRVAFLGGMNEIGKNMTVYEYAGDMFIVDCGLAFPGTELLGVDSVIPDFSYVEANADKVKGLIVTHGHEDHIGGIPYLLKKFVITNNNGKIDVQSSALYTKKENVQSLRYPRPVAEW